VAGVDRPFRHTPLPCPTHAQPSRRSRAPQRRPLDKQPHRVTHRQLMTGHRDLTRQPHQLPAGSQHPHPRATTQQRRHQPGTRLQHVLTIVQQHQQAAPTHSRAHRVQQLNTRPLTHRQRRRHHLHHQLRPVQRTKLNQIHTIGKTLTHPARQLQHQPRLTNPPRTQHRHQPVRAQQPPQHHQLLGPPNETVQRQRQPAHRQPRLITRPRPNSRLPARPLTAANLSGLVHTTATVNMPVTLS
jgi:hypothetical protein